MNKIVQNPVHPLDLDLNSLIIIYKKFEQAKRISNNPNQELPIDVIVQLVARLINHEPSAIQKLMTKSLYKTTLSWNEFLNFLDKESEARENILNWIMYEMNVRKFKLYRNISLKFAGHFEEITYMQSIVFEGKIFYIVIFDKYRMVAFERDSQTITTTFEIKPIKNQFEVQKNISGAKSSYISRPSQHNPSSIAYRRPKARNDTPAVTLQASFKHKYRKISSSLRRPEKERIMKSNVTLSDEGNTNIDEDETYLKKERKKISKIFDIFKQLPIDESKHLAEFFSNKLLSKKIHDINVQDIRDSYTNILHRKEEKSDKDSDIEQDRLKKTQQYLKRFYNDKKKLNYNPYRLNLKIGNDQNMKNLIPRKRVNFEKKQRQNYVSIRTLAYLDKYKLIALALFNFEVVLVQLRKQYNKIQFHELDIIKLPKESDKKKNQIVQKICFHYHQILKKYQLIVLIRVEKYSYLRCFNLIQIQNPKKISEFSFSKEAYFCRIELEMISMVSQKDFGLHLISNEGILQSYKDDLNQNLQLYSLHYKHTFKTDMLISCVDISISKKKLIFGTLGGYIMFMDNFTKETILTKKISNSSIISTVFDDRTSQVFILSADQVITIYDTNKLEQVQILRVKNQDRLNQRMGMFSLSLFNNQTIIHCFGSELRQFISFIDQEKLNKKKKVQFTYKWRLNKLSVQNITNIPINIDSSFITQKESKTYQIIGVFPSDKYFATLSKKNELKLISKKSYKIKYSIILDLSLEENIITFNISKDSKMVVFSLESQYIRIVNVYTEEVYLNLYTHQKITQVQFLTERNQYFIVTGSQNGKISFFPSYQNIGKVSQKVVQAHKKMITGMLIIGDVMITSSEDGKLITWQMPFNIIKYEVRINDKITKQYIVEISASKNVRKVLCRGYTGLIYQIDAYDGVIKQIYQQLTSVHLINFSFNEQNNQLYTIDDNWNVCIYDYEKITSKTAIGSQRKNPPESGRKISKKQTKIIKKKPQLDLVVKWKLKLMLTIKDKDIQSIRIYPNPQANTVLFFCSKLGFYVYEQMEERFKGKYTYSGEFIKNQNNKLFLQYSNRPMSALK